MLPDDEDELEPTIEETLGIADEVEDTPDGGAIVRVASKALPKPGESSHFDNLAEDASTPDLKKLATMLIEFIDRDKSARSKRDEQYAEGIRRTGLGDEAPGGAQFEGANKVVHPMLTEACVDFAARSMKEIFPSGGPVKDFIPGKVTRQKLDKAKRKTNLLNWQLTVQCPEVRSELEQLMTQVPLGGAQYLKVNWNTPKNRPTFLFVAIDDMLLPYAATNFYSSQRKTHVQYLTQLDYEQRCEDGMYIDADLRPTSMEPEQTAAATATDKIEGRESTSYNEDGLRTVYECHATLDIDFDEDTEGAAPYIVTIDLPTNDVLAVYRNWDEDDEVREELTWFVEWPFIPWRGAYPIGLPHMIGGLAGASTGALRALLDSAHINNTASMVKLKGAIGGQNATIQPTQILELEGTFATDDIRKLAMPLPFNPPSAVLFQLLGFLVDAGKGVVRTSMEDIPDASANQPVGTTLAKIEQGMVVYSSIHQRLHDAMARMLRILHRLNAANLDDAKLEKEAGEVLATRADFDGPLDVVPVSDPNIFSETQRFAQAQAVVARAEAHPELYNARHVEERLLEVLKIPDAEGLLSPPPVPDEMNAVNENVAASMGRMVVAFPDQDHIAHLRTHLAYLMSPIFGSNKLIATQFIPVILGHIREHVSLWYAQGVFEAVNEALGQDITDIMREIEPTDVESRKAMDAMLSEAGLLVVMEGTEVFQALPPIIAQAEATLQSFKPQPPPDPLVQIEQAKIQQKAQSDQAAMQLKQQALQQEGQFRAADGQAEMQQHMTELQFKAQQEDAERQFRAQQAQAEMQFKAQLAMATAQQDQQARAAELAQSGQLSVLEQQSRTEEQRSSLAVQIRGLETKAMQDARRDEMAHEAALAKEDAVTQREMLKQQALDAREQDKLAVQMEMNEDDNATAIIVAEINNGEPDGDEGAPAPKPKPAPKGKAKK